MSESPSLPTPEPPARRADRFFARLAACQYRHPWLVLLAVLLTAVPAGWASLRLRLKTDWTELLPEKKRSIQDLRRIQERVGGIGTLTVFLEGGSLAARERFADDLAARAAKLPRELVRYVDKDLKDERAFFEANRWLYVETGELEKLRDRLKERVTREKSEKAFDLGLDEGEGASPAEEKKDDDLGLAGLRRRYDERVRGLDKFPGGYYLGEGDRVLLVFVRSAFSSNKVVLTNRLFYELRRIVVQLDSSRYDPDMQVSYTGDLMTALEEHDAVRDDLLAVSAICLSLILASIYLFYFELRAILVLGAGILVGLAWTFAATYLHIGSLNTATAFLSSIVAGNGINSGIILIARFLEERRRRVATPEAMRVALQGTWVATLIATAAASISYGALVLTDFRGFNQFGFIGGAGLLLCWVSNYAVVPTLLGLTDRLHPSGRPPRDRAWNYGRPFFAVARRAPGVTAAGSALLALLGLLLGWRWIRGDPFEYDFRRLRNERSTASGAGALQGRVSDILSGRLKEAMVVLADRPDQVPLLVQALERVREERARVNHGIAPIGEVRSLASLVPADQKRKLALLHELRDLALEALPTLAPEKRADLERWVPPETIQRVTLADVPEALRRLFRERDGSEGRVVLVHQPDAVSLWDGHGLLRFADAVRAVELPNGEVVHSSHRAVIFADMLTGILEDGPWLTLASLAGVVVLVLLAFRRLSHTALVLLALLIGMGWMIGLIAITTLGLPWLSFVEPIKLNFLNFIAIPITLGIGVDYAVNILRRYVQEGWAASDRVLLETGGAVILCSLTTIWGYVSLLYSDNQALRSFGKLAVLGEVTCLAAAVLVLPSVVMLGRGHGQGRPAAPDPARSGRPGSPRRTGPGLPAERARAWLRRPRP